MCSVIDPETSIKQNMTAWLTGRGTGSNRRYRRSIGIDVGNLLASAEQLESNRLRRDASWSLLAGKCFSSSAISPSRLANPTRPVASMRCGETRNSAWSA